LIFGQINSTSTIPIIVASDEYNVILITMKSVTHNYVHMLLLSMLSSAIGFSPQFSVHSGVTYDAVMQVASAVPADVVGAASPSMLADTDSLLISVAEQGESVTRPGMINWENPAEAAGGAITLLYIGFSILAGIKYVVKDGWRPKF